MLLFVIVCGLTHLHLLTGRVHERVLARAQAPWPSHFVERRTEGCFDHCFMTNSIKSPTAACAAHELPYLLTYLLFFLLTYLHTHLLTNLQKTNVSYPPDVYLPICIMKKQKTVKTHAFAVTSSSQNTLSKTRLSNPKLQYQECAHPAVLQNALHRPILSCIPPWGSW